MDLLPFPVLEGLKFLWSELNALTLSVSPFKQQPHKMVKRQPANCLSAFDHFVGLALKRLTWPYEHITWNEITDAKPFQVTGLFIYPMKTSEKRRLYRKRRVVWIGLISLSEQDKNLSFSTNVPLLYPLKTSENLCFSDVFRWYRSETLVKNGLIGNVDKYLRKPRSSRSQMFFKIGVL